MKSAQYWVFAILSCSLLVQSESGGAAPGKIYRIGGDVKAPEVISWPQPAPDSSGTVKRTAKTVDGSTILTIVVAADGSVSKAKVRRGLQPDLDAKALEAVKQWRFKPAKKNGIPVPVEVEVQINFHLYK